jgi:hypothetical protein
MTIPYEDVLDHCELVLTGKVGSVKQGEKGGELELKLSKVLRGKLTAKTVRVAYSGTLTRELASLKDPKTAPPVALLCIRDKAGKLRLAGDPPKGGGIVIEGPDLAKKLLEAAKDPAKGFKSKDFSVKLSSAYRLAWLWLKAPKDKKPQPPPGLIETFLEGLKPDKLRGRNVNAAARDALNLLLETNITMKWDYSVNHRISKRKHYAAKVKTAWQRTASAVRDRRPKLPVGGKTSGGADVTKKAIAKLVKQLGSDSTYAQREAAHKKLLALGKLALEQVEAGTKSEDRKIAERCGLLVYLIKEALENPLGADKDMFNLNRAEPFVPKKKIPKKKKEEEKVPAAKPPAKG